MLNCFLVLNPSSIQFSYRIRSLHSFSSLNSQQCLEASKRGCSVLFLSYQARFPSLFHEPPATSIIMAKGAIIYVFIPIFSGFVWLGMLLGMLLWWTVKEGSPHIAPMAANQHIA